MRGMWRLLLVVSGLLMAGPSVHAQVPAYESDPKFVKEVAAAKEPRQEEIFRLGHWKKANKIAGGACQRCLFEMAELQSRMGDVKAVTATTRELEAIATSPTNKGLAEFVRGSTLFHANRDKPKPEQLEAAAVDFEAAKKNDPKLLTAGFMEGRTLALLGREEDARKEFLQYVEDAPASDRLLVRARHFAANPALARQLMAPPFTVETADGKRFSLDDMGGRVVLVDFWATWCGPCNRELPHIKHIAQEFAGQPFVLISVSWDSDAGKWSEFVAKNGMTWSQYRDADHALSTAYGVDAIPHYFTIDSDGVLQAEQVGEGANLDGRLRKLVAKARESQVASAAEVSGH